MRSPSPLIQPLFCLSCVASAIVLINIYILPLLSWCVATTLTCLVVALLCIKFSTCSLVYAAKCVRYRWAMPRYFSFTVITGSLYTVTMAWVLVVCTPYSVGGGKASAPIASAATCA